MLNVKDISYEYDNTQVLSKSNFSLSAGDKFALVGPNGSGKTTLLKIMAGLIMPSEGSVTHPNGLNIGYMPQEIEQFNSLSGEAYIMQATGISGALAELELATANYANIQTPQSQADYQASYDRVEALQAYSVGERIGRALNKVGLDNDVLSSKLGDISGGQKTKLALAAILLSSFDVFLLDEPTNNIDLDGLAVLEKFIAESKSAFVIVSHDRRFIRSATKKIAELKPGGVINIYSLGYDEYVQARKRQNESTRQKYDEFTIEKKRLQASAQEREQNARAAANSGDSTDNDKLVANAHKERAASTHAKAAAAITTKLRQLKVPTRPDKEIDLNFKFKPSDAKLPAVVAELKGAVVSFGGITIGPYDFVINSKDKIAIVGPNGGGKSTLIKLLAGVLMPSSGTVSLASGVKVGYINQDYSFADDTKSVINNLLEATNADISELYNLLANFNVRRDKAEALPTKLSPGQRSRALLACMVASGANLLLLDEPTNHLDINASDELQNALSNYTGTLVVVTHDRELLDALANKKLIVVEDGKISSNDAGAKYLARTSLNHRPPY